ncbi:hypothetical protein PTKIN_Ptkin05aG0163800 [Pterospermum kingtungense]
MKKGEWLKATAKDELAGMTDSIARSSSTDDFAALLDVELEVFSSGSLHNEQDDEDEYEEAVADNKNMIMTTLIVGCTSKRCKTEKLEDLEKPLGSTFQVLVEEKIDVSLNEDICTHPGSFGQMCILYGKRLGDDFDVTFGYIHKGLKLGYDEIVQVCSTGMGHLLRQKQLHLILDLDHTLLNSTLLMHLTSAEEYLKAQFDSLQDLSKGSLFMLNFMHMMMKLRPFVRSFLNHAKEMFELHIYTMGDRHYALEMDRLLDPKREYFSGRVISRDDGTQTHQKGLNVVLGHENAVVILDDTENELDSELANRDVREIVMFCERWQSSWELLAQLHVVSTEKSRWAVKEKKFLVHPQ